MKHTETKMGRPKEVYHSKTMSFDLDEAMFDELVSTAEDRGQTKSEFVPNSYRTPALVASKEKTDARTGKTKG